jgi:hypothetical protein
MPQSNTYAKMVGSLYLAIHTKTPPSDKEWDDFLLQMPPPPHYVRALVFTDGGAPSAAQRKRLSESTAGRDIQTAVLSHALLPRFVNASISLFIKSMRSFNPEEFPQAIEYLKITKEDQHLLMPVIAAAQKELGVENLQTLTRALKAAKWA